MTATELVIEKARAIVALHDELYDKIEADSEVDSDENFLRWCESIDELRAALAKLDQP